MSVLVAIVGLALLIVLHEGGHFLVARLCGMRVERFSIGFGSPLVSFKRGDTIYQIAPIPLGGFVQITGLNPHEEFDHNDPYVYPNRPRWMRLAVLVAGPGANYLTAVVLALGIFMAYGMELPTQKVRELSPGFPAQTAGLQRGDVLISANGEAVSDDNPITDVIGRGKGKPLDVKVRRGEDVLSFNLTPRVDPKDGAYRIGVVLDSPRRPVGPLTAAKGAVVYPFKMSAVFLQGIWKMITGAEKASLSGPVGITRELAKRADASMMEFLQLMTALSIYLGLFNLLPLPALDGGRALFLGVNALRRQDLNAKTEATVHMVGLVVLLGLFVVVTFKDIKDIVIKHLN